MKALRIVLAVLAGVLVLLVIVAVIVVRSFDLNDYKDEIAAYVQERTGRTLTIDGNIEFSLFPWFAVETGGVSLSDDPAFGDRSFVTVDSLSARVRVWPLLRRRIEIGRVILDGLNVNLGMDADGRGNWATLLEAPEPAAPAGDGEQAERQPINALAVEGIEFRNVRILWHDPEGEVVYVVRDLTLVTGPVNDNDPVDVSVSLSLLDVGSQAAAAIELQAVAAIRPTLQLRDIRAQVRLTDAREQERASATLTLGSASFQGGVLSSGPAELTANLARPPFGPETLEVAARFDALTLDTQAESLAIDRLAASAGDIDATLNISGESMLSDPKLRGSVSLQAPLASAFETLGIEPLGGPGGSMPSDLGDLSAEANVDLGLAAGTLAIEPFTASLLGIDATGRAALGADRSVTAAIALAPFRPTEPLLALLAPWLPAGVDLHAISSAALDAALTRAAAGTGLDVDKFSVTLDGATFDGRLSIDDIGSPGEIGGALTASGLDNRLLGALFGTWLPASLVDTPLGEFRLNTEFNYELAAKTANLAPLELTAYGLTADGQLTIVDAPGALALSGRAAIAKFSPRDLLSRFDLPVPQTSDPTVFRSSEVAASFETHGADGEFRDIAIELDDSRITGEFSVENFADPAYRFLLRADRIDADRYLPPRAAPAGAAAAGAAATGAGEKRLGDIELASEPLTATNVTGSATVGRLHIGGMDFEQLSTDVAFGQGRAALSSVKTSLYGGSFSGGLTVDATGAPSTVRLTGDLRGIAINPLLTALLGGAQLSGTGDLGLDLTGSGDTINEALTTATGRMNLSFTNGEIDGVNLGRKLCAAVNAGRGLPAPAQAPNATPYSTIRGTATVSEGIASTSDLLATTSYLDVTGRGGIRLIDQWIDTQHRASLTGPIPIMGCEDLNRTIANDPIPVNFTLKGRLPDIDVGVDVSQLLQDWARREIRNRVREEAGSRLEDAIRGRLSN
jgi:uncharacterized protein involved in outer membrane biogenesis